MSVERLADAFDIEDIAPAAKLAMIYIANNSSTLTRQTELYLEDLAEFACVTEQTARGLLEDLVLKGYLSGWSEFEGWCDIWLVDWIEEEIKPARAIPKDVRGRIVQRDRVCIYCSCDEGPYHIDHIVPRSRGGSNKEHNLGLACATCNISKRDMLITEWAGRRDVVVSFEKAEAILAGGAS